MFKQRAVGFIVLGALAIIFWPIVFVSPEPEQDLMLPVFEMPERPSVATSERREPVLDRVDRSRLPVIEAPELTAAVDNNVVAVDKSVPLTPADTEPKNQSSARQRAEFDEQGLPMSWALQVATFGTESRAIEIAAVMREKGYKAYVVPITLADDELYRVMVGPNLQKQRLLAMKPVIDAYFGVDSVIVRFAP